MKFGNTVTLTAMLDSGSMVCTINETTEMKLSEAGVITINDQFRTDVVLIGCGVRRVMPKLAVYWDKEVYGCKVTVPTPVVQS